MQKILKRRVGRDLKENLLRYLALCFMIILSMYMIVSLVGAAENIITGTQEHAKQNQVEDGEFTVFVPLTENQEEQITDLGVTLEKQFYLDFSMEDKSTIRVFKNREAINQMELEEGRAAKAANEIVLEKRCCEEMGWKVGERIKIAGKSYQIVGIGTIPDYDAPYKKLSDSSVDSAAFGLSFVTNEAYEELLEDGNSVMSEEYVYAYRKMGNTDDDEIMEKVKKLKIEPEEIMDEYLDVSLSNLVQFVKAEDNPRIGAAANDQVINKLAVLVAGIIVMVLFTYVISVFVIHGIERESSIIGALYALGVKKRDLMLHYLTLPVLLTFLSGIVGAVLGFSEMGVAYQMQDCYGYFSLPLLENRYPLYLLIYAVVMPPVIAALVNLLVINKKLSQTALSLIRNEKKPSRVSNLNLGNMGFVSRFRIRQMMKEMRTALTVLFGMFISLLIMMMGIDCYVMCEHLSRESKEDTKYEYMYTYKYPDETVPKGGEACYAKALKKEIFGYNMEVTVLGIDEDNPYFAAKVTPGKNKMVISSAMAQKYGLKAGEQIVLSDEEEGMDYAFTVEAVTQFSTGLYAFMDIESMRELFGASGDAYNVVFSDHELGIDAGKLYAAVTREEIEKSSDIFIKMMMPMIYMMSIMSALIFCMVMYLMMKVMIERASFSISLVKIFGYRMKEIKKLYLNGNFYLIAAGAAVMLPLAKWAMDKMYPVLTSNISCGMNLTFPWQLYLGIYVAVIGLYLLINQLLVHRLKKLLPAEVLKNRE